MNRCVLFLVGYVLAEIFFAFLFHVTAELFYKKSNVEIKSIFKGMVERLFLFVAPANNYHHALTFFSVIKLATRLKHAEKPEDEDRFNDYYLVGNLISVMLGIAYVYVWTKFVRP